MFQAMFARRAVLLAVVICGLALTVAGPLRVYLTQQHEMAQLSAKEHQQKTTIAQLEHQKQQRDSDANEVMQARSMGYVFPGEIPVQVMLPTHNPHKTSLPPPSNNGQSTWYGQVWGSIAAPHTTTR